MARWAKIPISDLARLGPNSAIMRLLDAKRDVDESANNPFVGSFWTVGSRSAQGPRFVSSVALAEMTTGEIEVRADDAWTEQEISTRLEARGFTRPAFNDSRPTDPGRPNPGQGPAPGS